MEKFHQFIISLFPAVFLLCLFQLTASETVETEALLEFKNLLNDPLNHLKSWNDDKHPCQFTGIICHSESMNVIGISLMNMSLSGKLSPSLSSLRNLSSLQLQWNLISGAIPPQLANCTSLQFLNMSYNSFTGEVPDLSSLQKLQVLDLTKSGLTGKFPSWVGNLPELVHLALAYNDFEEGEVVPSLGNLKNLNVMFLAQCNLKGEIPSFISNLTSLGTFDLSQNQMSGEFPIFLTNLPKLWKIELFRNNLSGEIPPELGNLTSLREIDLSVNQMTGKIPTEVGNLNLTVFQIYRNYLSGEIPQGFGSMQFLDSFSIYENSFSGEFPADFGRFSRLNSIDISENNFTGPFPRFLCQNNNLQYLLALDNYFSGEFPDSYSTCKTLLRFRVSQNYLSGKIPDGVWGLPSAVIIDLADNGFSGGISSDIGMSTSLTQLYVQNNKFSGELPAEIGKLSQLQKIFAYNNSFSGQIPSEIGELSQLSSLQLEVNSLTGPVPLDIGKCSCLVDLNLAQNALNGNIPSSLTLLTSLNSLNLSNNRLVGSIPLGLQVLKLSSLDFSHNQLSGTIPPELLIIAGDNAFSRNPGLCIDQNSGNHCKFTSGHKGFFGRRIGVALVIMLIMFVLIAGLAIISYRNFMLEQSCKDSDIENGIYDQSKWKMESFHPSELNAEEISNLEEENLIGSGSTGKVYKLELNKNRGTVAVKQLWKGKGAKVMMAEIGILANIRHRNILKLYACLTKGESSYLVFEYMPNGNLHQALRRQVKGKQAELDWNRRYNIALGAAKGLMYLHHHCTPAIIHRDIKTANILLDEEYEAKIADFGIAKVAEDSDNSCFAGTHGYMAPELAYSLKVSEKSDVYSFGVVLLELLTGFTPTEPQFGEGKDIVYWVSTQLDGQKVRSMFDSRISDTASDDMIKVLRVAILCTKKLPSLRPSMREVVNMLNDADPCRIKNFVKKG